MLLTVSIMDRKEAQIVVEKNLYKPNDEANFIRISQMPLDVMEEFGAGILPAFDDMPSSHYLADFRPTYPEFQIWLNGKVFPEIQTNPEMRDVIFSLSQDRRHVVGFAVVKNTFEERKICSFYILPHYQHLGYGSTLMEECFQYLGTTTPLITMPERCKRLFEGLLKKYRFVFTHELSDYYSDGNTEYVFNGILKP